MSLGEFRCDCLAYADNVNLMAEASEQVEYKLVGWEINEGKMKLMNVTRGRAAPRDTVACGGMRVEVVRQFRYLDTLLTEKNVMEVEVLARMPSGTRCAAALRRCLHTRWL